MQRVFITVFLFLVVMSSIRAQIQNVTIGGSYSNSFMLSGSGPAEYKVAGSPYLSETWMFGSLEMKGDVIEKQKEDKKVNAQLHQYQDKINKINALIEKLSDPDYKATGLALAMAASDPEGEISEYDLKISNSDFEGISGITKGIEDNLLFYLESLRGEYEAQINDYFKLNGLFRYNLYAQEFEMVYNKDTLAITAPFNVKSISISNMTFFHGLYVKRGGTRTTMGSAYFQVLSEGDCKLLMRHAVKVKSGGGPVTFNWAGSADAFVQYRQLYYQEEDGSEVIIFKKRKKKIREIFAGHSEEVEKFIRSEKLKLGDDGDLVRIFNYYNTLDT